MAVWVAPFAFAWRTGSSRRGSPPRGEGKKYKFSIYFFSPPPPLPAAARPGLPPPTPPTGALPPWTPPAGSTLRSSRAVPHPTANRAMRRLTLEVGSDFLHSARYGRITRPISKVWGIKIADAPRGARNHVPTLGHRLRPLCPSARRTAASVVRIWGVHGNARRHLPMGLVYLSVFWHAYISRQNATTQNADAIVKSSAPTAKSPIV